MQEAEPLGSGQDTDVRDPMIRLLLPWGDLSVRAALVSLTS